MNITALVILYNSSIKNSKTIQCILKLNKKDINLNVIIWNNGPIELTQQERIEYANLFDKQKIQLSIHEDIRNIALSKVYNAFINKEQFDFFTILDQDSILHDAFFQNIKMNNNYDVIVPLIYSAGWRCAENSLCFPIYTNTDKLLDKKTFLMGEIESISSGLTLSYSLIKYLIEKKGYIFNTQYALYAIDTSFFLDLRELKNTKFKGLCVGEIDHSLDFNRQNPTKVSPARKLEMEYSNVLNKIFYDKKNRVRILLYLIRKFLRKEYSLSVFIKLVKCLITKRHPRSSIPIVIN